MQRPEDVYTMMLATLNLRMRALELCAQRMPKASVDELMCQADKVMAWASSGANGDALS